MTRWGVLAACAAAALAWGGAPAPASGKARGERHAGASAPRADSHRATRARLVAAHVERGKASYYAPSLAGRRMADGGRFDPRSDAAAHRMRLLPRERTAGLGFDAPRDAQARGVLFPGHLVYPWPRRTRDVFFEEVPRLPPGVSEIFAHPVLDGEELRAHDPAHADLRAHDAECLADPAVSDLLDRHGVKRVSYRELRDLQRAG